MSLAGKVEAIGGFGSGPEGLGGAGGVIHINAPLEGTFAAHGGSAVNPLNSCGNGAAGTVYHALD